METQPPNTGYFVKAFEKYRKSFVVIGGTAALLHIEERLDKKPRKETRFLYRRIDISWRRYNIPVSRSLFSTLKLRVRMQTSLGKAQAYRFTKPQGSARPLSLR